MIAEAAALEIKPGGKKISIGGPGRAVFVFSSAPKVFSAESDLFIRIPDKISGNIVGVVEGIPAYKSWIVGVHKTVDQV